MIMIATTRTSSEGLVCLFSFPRVFFFSCLLSLVCRNACVPHFSTCDAPEVSTINYIPKGNVVVVVVVAVVVIVVVVGVGVGVLALARIIKSVVYRTGSSHSGVEQYPRKRRNTS